MIAPELVKHHTVVCPDLRGYGASDKPVGDDKHEAYSKRTMAADIHDLMGELGHKKFAVVGHDRGALVGFRLALDYPDAVTHLAVLWRVWLSSVFPGAASGLSRKNAWRSTGDFLKLHA